MRLAGSSHFQWRKILDQMLIALPFAKPQKNYRNPRMKYRIAIITLFSALLFPALASSTDLSRTSGPVHHVVIVWLKDHGSQAARKRYLQAAKPLSKLPMVQKYEVGFALPGKRDVVDSSYDVAVHALFKNRRALDEYLAHPDHKKVIEKKLKPLVEKVVVYDFSDGVK
jgi:Stress responsive A/B Barrel Domain